MPVNESFGEAVCVLVHAKRKPIRLSDWFMKLWCGSHSPTAELESWLADRGLEIVPGLDHHAGWDVRLATGESRSSQPLFDALSEVRS